MAVYVIIVVYRTAASADATMATWGGSTVDNLESITEDGGGDQQDNEDEDDDGTAKYFNFLITNHNKCHLFRHLPNCFRSLFDKQQCSAKAALLYHLTYIKNSKCPTLFGYIGTLFQ